MALDLSWIPASAWDHRGVCCMGYLSADLSMWTAASDREGCCTSAVEPLLNIPFLRFFSSFILHLQMGSEVPFQTI